MQTIARVLGIATIIAIASGCKTSQEAAQPTANQPSAVETNDGYSGGGGESNTNIFQQKAQKLTEYQATETQIWDLIHTKLQVSFNWQDQTLNGAATIELSPYFYPQQQLVLDAKGFDLQEVQLLDGGSFADLKYEYDGQFLVIDLQKEIPKSESVFVYIEYTANPNALPQGGSEAISADKGLYFINPLGTEEGKPRQIWTQGETEANSKWFPTIDAPNQKMTQEIYITVNNKFKTLSNGNLISSSQVNDSLRTDYWRMDKPHAPYLVMMAIGDFAIVQDKDWKGKPVTYYVEPEYEPYAKAIFGNTPEMLTYFSELLDYEYPWSKYAQVVVRDYVSGAMENTSASIFMEDLQVDDRYLADDNWDDIIAHELFHQWFGDLVTCESWSNLPLNESFANYSEYLWAEYKYGEEAAAEFILNERASYFRESENKQVDLIRFYYNDREDMFDSHSYAKGGQILHMLRNYIGDEAFFASLSSYLKKNQYKPVEVSDLRLAFEETTGEDLNWFFNQWFMASGHPQLEVSSNYAEGKVILKVDQVQDFSTTPLYRLPVYVEVYTGGQKQRYAIEVGPESEFSLPVSAEPELVLFDPEGQLLAQVEHPKTAAQLQFQYKNAGSVLARYAALVSLAELGGDAALTLAEQALSDSTVIIRRLALGIIAELEGGKNPRIEGAVARLANSDKSTLVRADALSLLATTNPNAYQEQFRKGINEKSYAVAAASAYGYGYSNATDKTEVLAGLEDIKNGDLILVLADYYTGNNVANKANWFSQKIKLLSGSEKYYLINYFGQYLLQTDEESRSEGVDLLENLAQNHTAYYVRMAAYNALRMQSSVPNLEQRLQKIREGETDERVKQMHKSVE